MIREWKEYEFTCDKCKFATSVRWYASDAKTLPSGWGRGQTHDCGSTGYTAHHDYCPECFKATQSPRAASGDTEGSHPAKPLTGAELAAKHGFEPIPEWKRDPVARPVQSAASGDASKEET